MKKATKRVATAVVGTGLVFGAIGVSAASDTVTVEPGDTYWGLAQNYDDVSTNDLTEENDYDPQALPVGAEIVIPTGEENGEENGEVVTHVVQPGNTFSEIASVYDGVTVNDLLEANPNVDPYAMTIGSDVAIPVR